MGVTVVTSGGSVTVTTSQQIASNDATVSNSDDTYSTTVAAGGSLEIPDITVTKLDDTTFSFPAAKNLDIGDYESEQGAPSGWAEMVAEYGIGYNYPATLATTSYRTGDEADIESTIFTAAVRKANSEKPHNGLASHLVLSNNNTFGTTVRFTDELGTEVFANDLVIDHYTGLMWDLTQYNLLTWDTHIDNALASTFGGYSDWFLPSTNQLFSIANIGLSLSGELYTYSPFDFIAGSEWTSTTNKALTAYAFFNDANGNYNNGFFDHITKTSSRRGRYCRKHY